MSSWNTSVIEPLVKGALEAMASAGVKQDNIVVEDVSGSFELPLACSRCVCCMSVQMPPVGDPFHGPQGLTAINSRQAYCCLSNPSICQCIRPPWYYDGRGT